MQRFFADLDSFPEDQETSNRPHPLTTALLAFDACRSEVAQETGYQAQPLRVSEPAVIRREPSVAEEIARVHNALPESEQLRIYRFYLTAVHRNSVWSSRFEPYIVSSPERSAAIEAEFDDITHQLEELVDSVAERSLDADKIAARLSAANFLWAATWWVHARQDVMSFVFDMMEDPFVMLLLGRRPDRSERVGRDIYQQAAAAELAYRDHVARAAQGVDERPRSDMKSGATTSGSTRRRSIA